MGQHIASQLQWIFLHRAEVDDIVVSGEIKTMIHLEALIVMMFYATSLIRG